MHGRSEPCSIIIHPALPIFPDNHCQGYSSQGHPVVLYRCSVKMVESLSDPAVRKGRIPGVDAGMGVSGHVTGSEALILYGNFSIFFHNFLYYLCELPNLRNTFYKGISL